ncbi:MAG: GxxExxY protein [Ignavibacteriaceae bacterium]|nr:GxxExxY protein [Ignavibacteriaceae bacterium]
MKAYYDVYNALGFGFLEKVNENVLMIELKASEGIINEHEAQLLNYLNATEIEVGLLLNFGKKPQFKRQIFENKFKKSV